MNCPLCLDDNPTLFSTVFSSYLKQDSIYYQCPNCELIYLDSHHRLNPEQEKARYDTHNNDPNDLKYRAYLTKAISPLLPFLKQGDIGLDFGSGPGPTLSIILQNLGFPVFNYDPYYANDEELLTKQYQFVTSTEVFEHLNAPNKILTNIKDMLLPDGLLCIMTQLYTPEIDFESWWYKNDPTHIVFYSEETMNWIAINYKLRIEYLEDNIIIFKNEK